MFVGNSIVLKKEKLSIQTCFQSHAHCRRPIVVRPWNTKALHIPQACWLKPCEAAELPHPPSLRLQIHTWKATPRVNGSPAADIWLDNKPLLWLHQRIKLVVVKVNSDWRQSKDTSVWSTEGLIVPLVEQLGCVQSDITRVCNVNVLFYLAIDTPNLWVVKSCIQLTETGLSVSWYKKHLNKQNLQILYLYLKLISVSVLIHILLYLHLQSVLQVSCITCYK